MKAEQIIQGERQGMILEIADLKIKNKALTEKVKILEQTLIWKQTMIDEGIYRANKMAECEIERLYTSTSMNAVEIARFHFMEGKDQISKILLSSDLFQHFNNINSLSRDGIMNIIFEYGLWDVTKPLKSPQKQSI
ncbi:MAG: hypothetical protein Sylvanvirus1_65 [Sylvanvirus sp.]|uniref:Uncharacterized protein n=1 Tax=Sylvanvirus sp. TaxID=2487774 RepID=A0A3G5AKL9_9VIRU|nr:MAG: hypothetical protein Sylvanvirus1_65 [Sylvanvirus sp.]